VRTILQSGSGKLASQWPRLVMSVRSCLEADSIGATADDDE